MQFFIPDQSDPDLAEAQWRDYVKRAGAPGESRRIQSVTYEHEGSKFVVTVGRERQEYPRQTGPRGGYIKNAGPSRIARSTGTKVLAIVDSGGLIYVFSDGPPFRGWANPSLVGRRELVSVEYFDE